MTRSFLGAFPGASPGAPPDPAPPEDESGTARGWPQVERRAHPRHRIRLPATFIPEGGRQIAAEVLDISAGGIRLAVAESGTQPGARGRVAVEALCGPLPCTVMGAEPGMLRLRFEAIQVLREGLVERLASLSWDPRRG